MTKSLGKNRKRCLFVLLALLSLALPLRTLAQGWTWQTESVDDAGKFTSIAVDHDGNLHVSYADGKGSIKYAFRDARAGKWYTMIVDAGDAFTDLKLDNQGKPHMCYTFRVVKYASFVSNRWQVEPIAPNTGEVSFSCSVALTPDGTPIVSWYKTRNLDNTAYDHLKAAMLQDGLWLVHTVDFDMQTGKWHSLTVDAKGVPHVSYDAFVKGMLKYASWDGKNWQVQLVDVRGRGADVNLGMGNSIVLNPGGQIQISYQDSNSLKFGELKKGRWANEVVDSAVGLGSWVGWRTSLAIDHHGRPHISYEDAGTLKHAYRDETGWHIQVIASRASDPYRYSSLAIDDADRIYVSYRDPLDGSLKVALGSPASAQTTVGQQGQPKQQ